MEDGPEEETQRLRIGMACFAEALLIIPKCLAQNSGFDAQRVVVELQDEVREGNVVGLNVKLDSSDVASSSKGAVRTVSPYALLPDHAGIWDNYCVKKQFVALGTIMATNLILVCETMRAGQKMGGEGVRYLSNGKD